MAAAAYLFSGLPVDDGGGNAQFVVDVTDTAGVLVGYWHSLGTAGLNNNSQIDPYAVTLTPGAPNNLTADFGYYILPGAVGNRVWLDDQEPGTNATDGNGIQNAGEPGIANVKVTLTIVYPNATVGDGGGRDRRANTGYYSFGNLLLDEDFNGAGGPEPTHTISVNGASRPWPATSHADQCAGQHDLQRLEQPGRHACPAYRRADQHDVRQRQRDHLVLRLRLRPDLLGGEHGLLRG